MATRAGTSDHSMLPRIQEPEISDSIGSVAGRRETPFHVRRNLYHHATSALALEPVEVYCGLY